jgi:tetratricopeptide (TPR) repeat protein
MIKMRPSFGLLMLMFACGANAFGQDEPGGRGLNRLTWPGKDWSADVSLAPFTNTLEDALSDDTSYLYIATLDRDNPAAGRILMLTIRMQAAKDKGSDRDARDSIVKRLKKSEGIDAASVKTFEYKQIPALRYTIANPLAQSYFPYPAPPGAMAGAGRGIEAFFVKDDVLLTFRLNGIALKKQDEQLFYAVLDSLKFTDTSTPSSSFDYFYKGKTLIRQKQYAEAAANLNIALGLERKRRQLDDAHWRNLIGHLLDIYSATGDRARVKELLDYGVGSDPAFPLFHLGLAYYYASQGDVDNTIAALERAYLYRKNDRRTAGWAWVEPLAHPAFEPFRKNEKFRKAVKGMKK